MFNLLTNYNYFILFLLLYNYNYILNNQRYIVLFNSTITKYLIIFISAFILELVTTMYISGVAEKNMLQTL